MEQAVVQDGLYAAGFVSYEAAPAFDGSLVVNDDGHFPLLWFGLYEGVEEVELPAARALNDAAGAPTSSRLCAAGNPAIPLGPANALSRLEAGAPDWQASVGREEFDEAMARIKALIRSGDTYQVNYTYRLRTPFAGNPWNLFLRLVAAQDPPYGAFLDTGEWVICSASPELFFRLDGTRIQCRPMKGTAARGRTQAEDLAQAQALQASEKERAENVMIVDMVRHDLGRVAQPGSVKVARLFEVERYPTIWQMTSTVEAQTEAGLGEIFQALFPAASVTGAPKVRTMQIIADLEPLPRRLYTGAIGFFAPGRRAQFNVAIRTLLVNRKTGFAEYGVGSGITWDSDPEAEWQECRAKARILAPQCPLSACWKPCAGRPKRVTTCWSGTSNACRTQRSTSASAWTWRRCAGAGTTGGQAWAEAPENPPSGHKGGPHQLGGKSLAQVRFETATHRSCSLTSGLVIPVPLPQDDQPQGL